MPSAKSETTTCAKRPLVLYFTGRLHPQGNGFAATCDHAPLVTQGIDEDEALTRMERAIELYLRTLDARGEVDMAVRAGKLQVRFADGSPQNWAGPRLQRVDSGFVAELAGV